MEWVKVEDGLPEVRDDVLVFGCDQDGENVVVMGTYSSRLRSWYFSCLSSVKVTHWMPLPQPPTD